MSTKVSNGGASAPIQGKEDLIDFLAQGCKPADQWKIGTEHEKFVYCRESLKPVPYEGKGGIHDILSSLTKFGWTPVEEDGHIIALSGNGASVSLEPGGQLELSGAPLDLSLIHI